jgi:hypothetical protein
MRVRAIAASALALAGLAVACSRVDDAAQHGGAASADAGEAPRARAPAFTLPDLGGTPVRLAEFEGRGRVLVGGATWGRPCLVQGAGLDAGGE